MGRGAIAPPLDYLLNMLGVNMKKLVIILAIMAVMLFVAAPALAASLGMSPSKVEVTVAADSSATIAMTAYYYTGDIQITLENIPLRVSPEAIHVDAADNPQDFQLTFYGDPSLGSKIYDGYIRFQSKSGEMIAIAVKVKAHVTNLVAGEEPVLVAPPETPNSAPKAPLPSTTAPSQEGQVAQVSPPTTSASSAGQGDIFAGLSLNMIIIIAAGVVFVGLIILSISLIVRRRRF